MVSGFRGCTSRANFPDPESLGSDFKPISVGVFKCERLTGAENGRNASRNIEAGEAFVGTADNPTINPYGGGSNRPHPHSSVEYKEAQRLLNAAEATVRANEAQEVPRLREQLQAEYRTLLSEANPHLNYITTNLRKQKAGSLCGECMSILVVTRSASAAMVQLSARGSIEIGVT